jgi:hypothetical protein
MHLLGTLQAPLDRQTQHILSSLLCLPLHKGLESTQASSDPYSLILPAWLDFQAEDVRRDLHDATACVAADVNTERCRLFFDSSNESCLPALPERIAALAQHAGIRQLSTDIHLISQNRLMAGVDLPIVHACADLFPVCTWDVCRRLLLQEGHVRMVGVHRYPSPCITSSASMPRRGRSGCCCCSSWRRRG